MPDAATEVWIPAHREPKPYCLVICRTADQREFRSLAYVPTRGGIIEPITNHLAEPVIGPIVEWRYTDE